MIQGRGPRRLTAPLLAASWSLLTVLVMPAGAAATEPAASSPEAVVGTAAATERAPVGEGALSVRITTLSPAVPTAGATLTVRGTITNVATVPVSSISAVLRVSPTPLPSRGEIPEVLAGAGQRIGLPVAGTADDIADTLPVGASREFSMEAAVDDLGLASPGVYVTGVEAQGDAGNGIVRQDIDRTFLPWWPTGTSAQPLLLTTLWPISTAPVRDADGVLLEETPAVEMSPAGRLATLVDAAAAEPGSVSLVLDPDTVATAAQLADGYQVRDGDQVVEGTRAGEAATWLAHAHAAATASDASVVATLNGMPDLVAASRGRVLAALLRQRELVDGLTEQALGTAVPSSVAMLPGGTSDDRTLTRLAGAELAVVLSDQALPLATSSYFTPSGSVLVATDRGDLRVLLTDSGLTSTLAMPMADSAETTAARQRLLAETLVTALELPETQRLLVMAPDPAWSPSTQAARMVVDVTAHTPWLVPTPVEAALAREPSTLERAAITYDDAAAAAELPARQVSAVRSQFADLISYSAVLTDPAVLPTVTLTAPNRGMSAWFRAQSALGADLVSTVEAQIAAAVDSVRVVSSGSVTVSGASGTVPITVENLGALPVTVGLEMNSTPPQLFVADPVAPFVIEPGRRTSLEVTAQVAAAGPIPVTIQLTTTAGRPFGTPGTVTVQSSAYANAAGILVRVALAALALAVILHGIRRARRMRKARRARAGNPAVAPDPEHAEVTGA